jgi:hypothetical protein
MPTRQEAHAQARALTLAKGLDFYDVDDPASAAAQSYEEYDEDEDE